MTETKVISHYTGSLDFSCDFCGGSSYDNFHFMIDTQLKFVVCGDCLQQVLNNGVNNNDGK